MAFSYARFSALDQLKGDSFRRQTALAEDYAQKNGLDLDRSLSFHDIGVSAFRGRNAETGQLAEMLEAIRCGLIRKGSVILVESLDRISRQSARKAIRIIEEIVESGVSVVTLSDGREYTADLLDKDPLSLLLALLTFIRANEESELKSLRVSAAWVAKRSKAQSKPLTARCPGWLQLSSDGSKFILIKSHAKTIRWIVDQALIGRSAISIVRELNKKRILPPSNGRVARRWYACNIRRLLKHEALVGDMTPHRLRHEGYLRHRVPLGTIKGYYPAIVSRSEFNRLQALRKIKSSARQKAYPVRNIIARIGRCGQCGGAISLSNKSKRAMYLVCRTGNEGAGCTARPISYWEIEHTLITRLADILTEKLDELDALRKKSALDLIVLIRQKQINADKINKNLKILVEKAIIFQERGHLRIFWQHRGSTFLRHAFSSNAKQKFT